jgi:hypothetical protein
MPMNEAKIEACARAMQRFDADLASDQTPLDELDPRDKTYWRQRAKVGLAAAEQVGRKTR